MEKHKMKISAEDAKKTAGLDDIKFSSKKTESTRKGSAEYTKTTNSTLFTKSTTTQSKSTKGNRVKKTKKI